MPISVDGLDLAARWVLQALLDGMWRGAALTLGAALLIRAIPSAGAATRHAVWWAALALVVALPLLPGSPAAVAPGGADSITPAAVWTVPAPPGRWPLAVLALLAGVAALRLVRVAVGVFGVLRLKGSARPLRERAAGALAGAMDTAPPRGAAVRESARISTPVALGLGRPVVLLPVSLLDELTEEELLQVTLHELAHLRRRDDWGILAQRVLEALFWFHPAVRWICARLELEREIACDDAVVAATGSRGYAHCLTRLARLAVQARRAALAPGAAPGRSHLARRIGALLSPRRPASPRASLAGVALAAALLLGTAAGMQRLAPALELAVPRLGVPPLLRAALVRPAVSAPVFPVGAVGEPAAAAPAPPEDARLARLDAAAPEPRVVGGCGPGDCGGAGIVRSAATAPRAPRAERMARGPAPPLERPRQGRPGLEITVSLPGSPEMALRPSLGLPGEARDPGGWSRGFRLRVLGGGSRWRPHAALPARW
jgi:Zn-dependent protease with chaperone function